MARVRTPAAAWTSVACVLVVAQYLSSAWYREVNGWASWPGWSRFLASWQQFDAGEFVAIADDGYWYERGERSPTSFFPLFPLAIRAVRPLVGDTLVAAVIVSAVGGFVALVLLWSWLGRWDVRPEVRRSALWLFALYPWAWFLYGVPFSDGLFVALVIAAFSLVEEERFLLAGLVGALATATRPTGLVLMPALVLLALERAGVLRVPEGSIDAGGGDGGEGARWQAWFRSLRLPTVVDRTRFRPMLLGPVLAVAGVGAYSAYLGVRFGAPFAYITDQSLYNGTGPKTWLKAGLVQGWLSWDDPLRTIVQTAQALLALGVLVLVPAIGRRVGWGYGLFALTLVAMPALATRDFNSTGRYLLAAFPAALVGAELLADRPRLRRAILVASAASLFTLNALYAQSRMVS